MDKNEVIKEFLLEEIREIEKEIAKSVRNSHCSGECYDHRILDDLMTRILILETYL